MNLHAESIYQAILPTKVPPWHHSHKTFAKFLQFFDPLLLHLLFVPKSLRFSNPVPTSLRMSYVPLPACMEVPCGDAGGTKQFPFLSFCAPVGGTKEWTREQKFSPKFSTRMPKPAAMEDERHPQRPSFFVAGKLRRLWPCLSGKTYQILRFCG